MTDRIRLRTLTTALLATTLLASPVFGEAVLDGTTGSTGSFSGDFEIPAEVGRRAGANLFHSFERFHVRLGESATFTGPDGIDNVVSRVTGDEASRINGLLRSTVPGADFWLLNPRGLVFGRGAQLDTDGSFHATTADELRFRDGSAFSATDPDASSFTIAAPEAFGFLGDAPGSIQVNRSQLVVDGGESLSLVGGNVRITGGQSGQIAALDGTINLTATSGPGAVAVRDGTPAGVLGGTVRLSDQANLSTLGEGGGTVRIRAARLVVENGAAVAAVNLGARDGERGIIVDVDRLRVRNQSVVTTASATSGDAGDIDINARDALLSGGSVIGSVSTSDGGAGGITISTSDLNLAGGSGIVTASTGTGSGGPIRIATDRLSVDNSVIGTPSIESGIGLPAGRAGSITIDATDTIIVSNSFGIATITNTSEPGGALSIRAKHLVITDNALVTSGTIGAGAAGPVDIAVDRLVINAGGELQANSGEPATPDAGPAGSLRVQAGHIVVGNGGRISSDTFGNGNAGTVTVEAAKLRVRGGAAGDARISSSALGAGSGRGGVIVVRADDIRLVDGGRIIGVTLGSGNSGAITVEASNLIINGAGAPGLFTGIASDAEQGTGNAGPLVARVDNLVLREDGQIRSDTRSRGNAGPVIVDAAREVRMRGGQFTGISSDAVAGSEGDAGNVLVSTQTLRIGEGTRISSRTDGDGRAGQVLVVTKDGIVRGGIETSSSTLGPAGNVALAAPVLVIDSGGIVGSSGLGDGPAGDVLLTGGNLTVNGADIRTEGREGGRINVAGSERLLLVGADVTSNGIVPSPGDSIIVVQAPAIVVNSSRVTSLTGDDEPITGSGEARLLGDLTVISTDSEVAASSTLEVTGLESDLTAGIEVLPTAYIDVSGLLRESCAARASNQTSSFTASGAGGVAPDPSAPLAGRYAVGGWDPTPAAFPRWALSGGDRCDD